MDDDIRERFKAPPAKISSPKPVEPPPQPRPAKKSKKWMKIFFVNMARLVVLSVVIVGGILAWRHFKDKPDPIPKNIRQSVSFPIYYPSIGSIDPSSIQLNGDLLTYKIKYKNDYIFASLQPPPKILDSKLSNEMLDRRAVSTPVGEAFVGILHENLAASLATDRSWLLLSTTGGINSDDLQQILIHLKVAE